MSSVSLHNRIHVGRIPASIAGLRAGDRVDWHARWVMIFLAVGVAARLIRYLLRFPLWGDESLLAVNFLDRDYIGLMRPLDCHQVAPLLFLWTELTAVKLLGFNEWSLRLFPLVCSIAGMFFFHRLARHVVRGPALVLAVAFFAVTYSGIRYASEVKPYGVDLTLSTLILLLTVRWWRASEKVTATFCAKHPEGRSGKRWLSPFPTLWALTAVMPLALGLSFTAVFVAGGASVAIAAVLFRSSNWHGWAAWTVYNAVMAASFLGWYWFGIRAQSQAELVVLMPCWEDAFPPHGSLLKLALWLVQSHAGPLLGVPVGGDNWGSTGTLLLCIAAVAVLARRARYRLLLLCAAPFALNLIAAWLRRYPYGGHMRLAMHAVPIVSILAGIGAAALLERFGRRRTKPGHVVGWTSRSVHPVRDGLGGPSYNSHAPNYVPAFDFPFTIVNILLLTLAVLTTARDFYLPGKEQKEIRNRDFAVWFWSSLEREHEVLCTAHDLPPALPALSVSGRGTAMPQFLCNERIFSTRQLPGKPCELGRVSVQRPLACVQYWSHLAPYDPATIARWLDEVKKQYDLIATSHYTLLQDKDHDREPEPADRVDVYEFAPKG